MTDIPPLNAVIFAVLGIVVFAIAFPIVMRLLPFQLRKEVVEERNVAAAIVVGAIALGLCWIIAATIH